MLVLHDVWPAATADRARNEFDQRAIHVVRLVVGGEQTFFDGFVEDLVGAARDAVGEDVHGGGDGAGC